MSIAETTTINPFDTVSFNCTACGKCCNSPPLLSVPELLHHESLFVGSLALRRISSPESEASFDARRGLILSNSDSALLTETLDAQLFSAKQTKSADFYVSLMPMAIDYESLKKCPALAENNQCRIQHNRKPVVCSMVPFDSLYPDSLQHLVLQSRHYGEECIMSGTKAGYQVVIEKQQVVSQEYQTALQQRRAELILEKTVWANQVYTALEQQLLSNPQELAKIPIDTGLLSISILPMLMVLCEISEPCANRCLQYINAQIDLIDSKIAQAIARKIPADKGMTKEFRFFKEKYLQFRPYLLNKLAQPNFRKDMIPSEQVNAVENYLGIVFNATG